MTGKARGKEEEEDVCMRVHACVRACMRACMRVLYVTTTAHKYNSVNKFTIAFLIFFNSHKVMLVYSCRKS